MGVIRSKSVDNDAGFDMVPGLSKNLPLFSVQPVPGKGKGLVACFNIGKGRRILFEKPLFTTSNWSSMSLMESGICVEVKGAIKDQATAVPVTSQQLPRQAPFSGIVKTNALPCGPDSTIGGVYPTICLINHSCLPNAHNSWNSDTNCETIHAIRVIKEGEEITISYDEGGSSSSRRAYLKIAFRFDYNYSLYILPPTNLQTNKQRSPPPDPTLRRCNRGSGMMKKPEESLADCHSLLHILNDGWLSFSR